MEFFKGIDPVFVNWVIIPLLIFCARLIDVSLGTLRIVFISKGDKVTAPILGFLEVLIWLVAIGQVMQNLNNVASYLAWAGGFAVGNYIGLRIEERLAIGQVVIRVITSKSADALMYKLRELGFRVTCVDAVGNKGKVNLLFLVVRRKDIEMVADIIRENNPKAFYSIENVSSVSDIDKPILNSEKRKNDIRKYFTLRKGK